MSSLATRASILARLPRGAVAGNARAAVNPGKQPLGRIRATPMVQRSLALQTRSFGLSARPHSSKGQGKEEPDLHKLTDDEYVHQQLPPELQSLKPTPPLVWISILVALGLVGAALPWKSFIDHIFYPDDDDDEDD